MTNVTPVYTEIKNRDPEAVYNAVRGENTYLLESCEGGEKVARYSFIGFNPAAKLTVNNGVIDFNISDPTLKDLKIKGGNPLEVLRNLMQQFSFKEKSPSRFFGGFVGYFSYDLVKYFTDLNGNARDDLKEPDCEFILAKNNIILDHKEGKTYLISHQFHGEKDIDKELIEKELREITSEFPESPTLREGETQKNLKNFSSNITRKEFMSNVEVARDYIYSGDIVQVVLSQRLETESMGDKFRIYQNLKEINPSPYMYYLDFGVRKIVGSSPEMLARVEGRRVETYPIAGTRPRGKTPEEDEKLEREMLEDEKERAEHVMLVDLGRNDVGRVAKYGTVKVTKFMEVEKYSHVQHMVSEVTGELKKNMDEFDAFQSIFPAGTVSGAPKVRAMEIIDELEPTKRGIYSGAVGYFSFNGNIDTAITIRTIVFERDKAYIQAGAGIVADSKPENEYIETMNKAKGMLKALEVRE
ncbi:MAG: anthranilate synthase component I [Candidatus Altiarchaeota archaeon]|nr:anthranilate synthase component I [Candidatus Altiarchaeota archaeon]